MSENLRADLIINAGWVIPILPTGEVLENSSILITNGKISHVLPKQEANKFVSKQIYDLPNHALMPGLINCHGHAAMTLLRGFAEDRPLTTWLQNFIWPLEQKFVSEKFVEDGTELAVSEMMLSGTTTFSDMYFFPEKLAEVAISRGIRCQISFPILDFPTAWAANAEDYLSKGLAVRDQFKHADLVTTVFGPHSTYTISDDTLNNISILSSELDIGIQIHLHETNKEVVDAVAKHGERPITKLFKLGLLGPKTQCVHMTQLNAEDIEILADTGSQVIHCPESNMKLASGICPVKELLASGINIGLGTDSAASNNDLNLFGEMQSAAFLAKIHNMDASALTAIEALTLGTLGGAKALGLDKKIGSLEVGKFGDLIAVDMSGIEMQPIYDIFSQLVYVNNGSQVTHSWIAGKQIMDNRKLLSIDLNDLQQRILKWQNKISGYEL